MPSHTRETEIRPGLTLRVPVSRSVTVSRSTRSRRGKGDAGRGKGRGEGRGKGDAVKTDADVIPSGCTVITKVA